MNNTRVILLPEEIYTYLLKHVFEQHLGRGISSGELSIAAETHQLLLKAQIVDYSKLGNAQIDQLKNNGVAIDLIPENPKPSPNGERTASAESIHDYQDIVHREALNRSRAV
jgi:hypothetical protein